ncbi:MAG TPA: glyoxalase superfamily protein [Bdellovibrio sp.]|uniref:glyoxalase superfamily protein n=1 Tax=Bdellovibrio sp. TaxID=28201 RepID=UPI002EFC6793
MSKNPPSRVDELKKRAKRFHKSALEQNKDLKLKDALNKIASLNGFANWRDLKKNLEETELFLNRGSGPSTMHWYRSYEEARRHAEEINGIIVPYQKDYFVGDEDYLRSLGLKKDDRDLALVGNDWSKPRDLEAFKRLQSKIVKFRESRQQK